MIFLVFFRHCREKKAEGSHKWTTGSIEGKVYKSVSRFEKVGLQFPVGSIARFLKSGKCAERIGAGAPVYLAAFGVSGNRGLLKQPL
jgi:hypothetical protein